MEPVKIAICDDEKQQTAYLRTLAAEWAAGRSAVITLREYPSAEAFLFDCEDNPADILLLDVQMGGATGLDLARKVRAADAHAQFIFVTAYADFAAEGYDVDAVHYLTKPVATDKLFAALARAAARLDVKEDNLLLETDRGTVRVPAGEVVLVESFAHDQEITTVKGVYSVKTPAYILEKQLGAGFIRCHRSYLVGLKYVAKVTRAEVALDNGRAVPLSRRLYEPVNKAFIRYFLGDET